LYPHCVNRREKVHIEENYLSQDCGHLEKIINLALCILYTTSKKI
jgi:hypothetical protein